MDSISKAIELKIGQWVIVRGKRYARRNGASEFRQDHIGEYFLMPVWNLNGQRTRITIRPDTRLKKCPPKVDRERAGLFTYLCPFSWCRGLLKWRRDDAVCQSCSHVFTVEFLEDADI